MEEKIQEKEVVRHRANFSGSVSVASKRVPLFIKSILSVGFLAVLLSGCGCDIQRALDDPKETFFKMIECQRNGDLDGFLACLDDGRFVAEIRDKTRDPELKRRAASEMKKEIEGGRFWVAEERINGDRAYLAVEGKDTKKDSSHLLGVPLIKKGLVWKIRIENLTDSDNSTVRKKMEEWLGKK